MKKTVAILTMVLALAITALAVEGEKKEKKSKQAPKAKAEKVEAKFMGMGDGIETCPVTGEKIMNKDISGKFFGRTVYFCCPGCLEKAQKNPLMYVKKTQKAQVAAVKAMAKPAATAHDAEHHAAPAPQDAGKFLGKGDGIETCPVTGEPVNKNVKAEIWGRTVYFCCEGCIETVKKNPELYLKKEPGSKAEIAFLGKGDGIETCPVTGEPVNKNVKAEIMGRTIYFCCAGCIETVKKNPEAYLRKTAR